MSVGTNAVPPPAPLPAEATSEPPAARVERARWEGIVHAIGLLLGSVTDWLGLAAVCYLAPLQKWPIELTAGAVVGLAGGTIIAKARGKGAVSTSAMLMTGPTAKVVGALLAGGSRFTLIGIAISVGALGCASAPALEQVRTPVNVLGERLAVLHRGLGAMCLPPEPVEPPPPAECSEVMAAYNDVEQAHSVTQTALDVVEGVTR